LNYYIASCVFTSRFPELSFHIQSYIKKHTGLLIVRCCVPKYKLQEFTDKMPVSHQKEWREIPDSGDFQAADVVYSLCHNCSAIIDEMKPGTEARSLWELILQDNEFAYPDYHGKMMAVQDCWRARDRRMEQNVVRQLLNRMNIHVIELEKNFEKTEFCGNSLFRPAPPRNLKLAPKRFVENAEGKFLPHTLDEQKQLMEDYCSRLNENDVVAYCHYCQEGLELGGVNVRHLASLLFEPEKEFGFENDAAI
jgi:hypothetical protein